MCSYQYKIINPCSVDFTDNISKGMKNSECHFEVLAKHGYVRGFVSSPRDLWRQDHQLASGVKKRWGGRDDEFWLSAKS